MTDLITQAIECLRKNGEPLLADAVHEVAVRADSLTLEVGFAVDMARDIAKDARDLISRTEATPGSIP